MVLFQLISGQLVPLSPTAALSDGKSILTLQQAAEQTGQPADALLRIWEQRFGPAVTETDLNGRSVESGKPMHAAVAKAWAAMTDVERTEQERLALYPQLTPEFYAMFLRICEQRSFSHYCRHLHPEMRVDPSTGQVKLVIMTQIDALVLVAQRTGQYQGQVEDVWCGDDGEWKDIWLPWPAPPKAARAGVMRLGYGQPIYGKALWESYAPYNDTGAADGLDEFWAKHGPGQLAKCALALAIRRAFAEETSGLYIREEMQSRGRRVLPGSMRMADDQRPKDDGDSQISDDTVESEAEFWELVRDAGFTNEHQQREAMANFRKKYAKMDEASFYRAVTRELRQIIRRRGAA